jgi:hypothetical protein
LAVVAGLVALGLGCLVLITGCPSAPRIAQPETGPLETYVHQPSGYRFPASLFNVVRDNVKIHDVEGQSVSCGYHLLQLCNFTVHVYPVDSAAPNDTLDHAFEFAEAEMAKEYPGAKRLTEESIHRAVSLKERDGKHAVYAYKAVYLQRNQTMRTELFLFQDGKWFVKYLATYPEGDRESALISIDAFLDKSFLWPEQRAKNVEKAKDADKEKDANKEKAKDADKEKAKDANKEKAKDADKERTKDAEKTKP